MAQHQNVYNQIVLNGFDVCEKPEHPRQHPHGRRRPPDLGEQNEKSDRQTNKMVLLDRHAIPIFLTSYPRVRARVPNARTCIQTDLSCLMQLRSRAFALLRHSSDSTSIQSRLRHSQEPGRRWSKMPAAGDRLSWPAAFRPPSRKAAGHAFASTRIHSLRERRARARRSLPSPLAPLRRAACFEDERVARSRPRSEWRARRLLLERLREAAAGPGTRPARLRGAEEPPSTSRLGTLRTMGDPPRFG